MKKILWVISGLCLVLLAVGATFLFFLYRASQQEPEFYQVALAKEPAVQKEAGDELEKNVLDLHNVVREEGEWDATFTDEQINGWLAADLPTKFPNTLPEGVTEPRVAITNEMAQIACRYQTRRFSAVVSIGLSAQVTDEPNVVAIRLHHVKAGTLPLPVVEKWKAKFETQAADAGVPIKWSKVDGDDVALVKLNLEHEEFIGKRLLLENIELHDGEVFLSGVTESETASDAPISTDPNTADLYEGNKLILQR